MCSWQRGQYYPLVLLIFVRYDAMIFRIYFHTNTEIVFVTGRMFQVHSL